MRRAKIVATLGPASANPETVLAMVAAGVNVFRLNLSHGTQEQHSQAYALVRDAAETTGLPVGVLADLQGPKIRVGSFADGPVLLRAGAEFTITTDDVAGDASIVSTTYAGLPGDVNPGDLVLIDDGRVCLRVLDVTGTSVRTTVVEGGTVSDHKGMNLPGALVAVPALSEKDVDDLRFALRLGVDWVALSFVRDPDDIYAVHDVMAEVDIWRPVVAKIEKPQAVARLADVLNSFDAIMIARGDLGVELPLEDVPLVQKRAISMAREKGKPVIVATQMLESMIGASRPTRAEASDVANAVLDGADALMLSGETGIGRYPVETVQTMASIIEATEAQALDRIPEVGGQPTTKGGAIARAAVAVAAQLQPVALVAFSETGRSARALARYRSPVPLLAFTPSREVRNQLALSWGVETFEVEPVRHTDEMVRQVDAKLLQLRRCEVGDEIVIVAGSPPGIPGSTNAMRVHRMGDAVGGIAPAYSDD